MTTKTLAAASIAALMASTAIVHADALADLEAAAKAEGMLTTVALPRIRDFRGLSGKQFDGHGNYTFGLNEQTMFYEIDVDKVDRPRGMDITVVTTATNDEEGRALLKHLGFPFKED